MYSKTKAQRQPLREAKNFANRNISDNVILEPGDDFSSESELEDTSNLSEERNKTKTKNEPAKLGAQQYGCPFCCKTMSSPYLVKMHILTHTGEKPFVCNVCGKAFNQKQHLKTHTSIHTGEKPFSCSKCDKGFNRKDRLQFHLNKYHSEQ